jgi:ribonuclease BN (tRNA processing enzyme)
MGGPRLRSPHTISSPFKVTFHYAKQLGIVLLTWTAVVFAQQPSPKPEHGTRIVMLGTGTPNPDPERAGPAVAIVVGNTPFLVDCGTGVVRRAAAAELNGINALDPERLGIVFITHLHSDHTLGYPDLILTPWILGRDKPLEAYGPKGLHAMTQNILRAWREDIAIRTNGLEHANRAGYRVNVHEIQPGLVYEDQNVKVTAFLVAHGSWKQAFGYRFDTHDRSIVLSGDTTPSETVVKACNGCDVLIHEVYSQAGFEGRSADWQQYHSHFHTSSQELGRIASQAKPGLLILYHQLLWGTTEAQLLQEIHQAYPGKVVSAHDLDVY